MKGYPSYLAFPFRIGADGRTAAPQTLEAHVADELLQLLLTTIGERAFLPELGTNLRRLVFEATDEATLGMTQAVVTSALATWLGTRVAVEALTVSTANAAIEVFVQYRAIGSQQTKVLRLQRSGG